LPIFRLSSNQRDMSEFSLNAIIHIQRGDQVFPQPVFVLSLLIQPGSDETS
jgi:hypothetical protein